MGARHSNVDVDTTPAPKGLLWPIISTTHQRIMDDPNYVILQALHPISHAACAIHYNPQCESLYVFTYLGDDDAYFNYVRNGNGGGGSYDQVGYRRMYKYGHQELSKVIEKCNDPLVKPVLAGYARIMKFVMELK